MRFPRTTSTQSGTFPFTVQANASGGSGTKQLSLFVIAPLELQTLVNKTPPESGLTAKKLVGQPLSTGVKAVGGRPPYTFTAEGTMPPGPTLDPATGAITGSGTTGGRYRFTVTVTDGTGTKASVDWFITTLPLLDFTKGKGLRVGKVGQTYSARIPVRGKDSSTARFAVAGEIPPGLEVDEDGQRRMVDWSIQLFERLGCRDYARFDFRADANGDIKLLEVNPNPGWCWDGKMNLMAEFADYRYADLLRMIIETAQARVVNSREAAGMGDVSAGLLSSVAPGAVPTHASTGSA